MLRAAALDTAERSAFLDQTLHDPELAAAVRRRLNAIVEELPSDFLADPTGLAASALEVDEPTSPIPEERYELQERLGVGGMAEVFRATDRHLQRTVALKRFAPDMSRLASALREARAQAQVHHPNVLDVYETGELDGASYIAMQYVEGDTLDRVARQRPLEARVRLVAEAADGLHAAHRRGLVHRDVKPSNILVAEGDDGLLVPYVGDFGIAIDADHAEMVSLAGIAGTPAFMAPEQLRGEALDRRVDVYGLGVTLYSLLTEQRPFDAETTEALIPKILAGAFSPPREVAPTLPKPLEAIILRAMATAPEERYPTAAAMADDLRRYLDGDVVEAYATGLTYRWTTWVLRHRALATVTSIALIVLLVGLVAFTILTQRSKTVADWRRGQAEELLGFMIGDLRTKLAPFNRLEVLEEVGDRALAYFRSVPPDELTPDELAQRSKALYQIGDVRLRRGKLDAAHEAFAESQRLADDLHRRDPDRLDWLFELGQSQFWIGYVDFERGRYSAALVAFERYLDIGRQLVAAEPDHLDYRHELAYGHDNVGRTLDRLGERARAVEHIEQQIDILREISAARPDVPTYRSELGVAAILLGSLRETVHDVGEAAQRFTDALNLFEALLAEQPDHHGWRLQLGTAHSYLGGLHENRGDLATALRHFEQQMAFHGQLADTDPDHDQWHAFRTRATLHVVRVLRFLDRWQERRPLLDDLIAELGPTSAPFDADDPRRLLVHRVFLGIELAADHAEAGDWESVEREARASLALFDHHTALAKNPGKHLAGPTHRWLGLAAWYTGRPAEAREHLREALRTCEPLDEYPHQPDLERLADALVAIGMTEAASRVVASLERRVQSSGRLAASAHPTPSERSPS